MIKYTVTALKHWQIDSNGTQSNATITGSAKTLAAAKRKARNDAQDYQNQAAIEYTEDGKTVYTERNQYGIYGQWTEQ